MYIARAIRVESDSDTCCVGSTITTWCKVSLISLIKGRIFRARISLKIFFKAIGLNYFDIRRR